MFLVLLFTSVINWLATMIGVWLIDQGIDAIQLGFMNTLLIAMGITWISGVFAASLKD
jgi:hypothetical protein